VCGFSALGEDDYFPMHVGNEWTYAAKNVFVTGEIREGTYKVKIQDIVENHGKTYFRASHLFKNERSSRASYMLYRKDDMGLYQLGEGAIELTERLYFVLPLKVGATWRRFDDQFGMINDNATITVIGLVPVEIAGNSYINCFHIRSTGADGKVVEEFWLAPNVGYVKSEQVRRDGARSTLVLKEYKPGK
jgi:hypothetical protein